jgi:hypothetical protein
MQSSMRDAFRQVREELDEMEANGEVMDEEARRAFFRERMQEAAQEQMDIASENGAMDEARGIMSEMLVILEQWLSTRTRLHEQLVADVKVQLTDDQLVAWPAFDRFLTREKTLPRGRLSGENLNLFMVLDDAGLSEEAFEQVEQHFDDYEIRLHDALTARNNYLMSSATQMYKAMRDGDADAARNVLERQVRYREAVRNVNDEYRVIFAGAIEDENERKVIDAAILADAYQRIYRQTSAERAFGAAMGLEDLSDEQLLAVNDLQIAYMVELAPRNLQLINLLRKSEAIEQVQRGERMVSMMNGDLSRGMPWGGERGDEENKYRESMERRNEFDESFIERLKALLTPEQQEALPQSRRGRGGWGGGGMEMSDERRKEIMDKYDTDKDGELSREERGKMFESFRNGGGGEGGGRGGRGNQ